MLRAVRHTGIVVRDLKQSLEFYQMLGFSIAKQAEEKGAFIEAILGVPKVIVTTAKIAAPDGQMIELLLFPEETSKNRPPGLLENGLTHIAFTVDDVDVLHRKLKMCNIQFISEPRTAPDGAARVCFCRSPEGIYLEFVEEMKHG